jgi:7,8-dihydropterin-6-yl-methyl-4-(beta-D-ribofuranosyl)aminobenzene 5'-phosphate synthase
MEDSMQIRKWLALLSAVLFCMTAAQGKSAAQKHQVQSARITILSTNLCEEGIGEWGFAALVEADGNRILFDTGALPDTVLKNAREMKIDLSNIQDVVLSHSHDDHTSGLMTLRRELAKTNPKALSRTYVAKGFFFERVVPAGSGSDNRVVALKADYERSGGAMLEIEKLAALFPGIWLLGPIPRPYPERNWSGSGKIRTPGGIVEDTIPEDTALVLDTTRGLVILSGCGHAGIINTIDCARNQVRIAPVYAAIGGFHLMRASDATVDWTAQKLREFGIANFIGTHCTGIEPVYRIREKAGLSRQTCIVGGVGDQFSLEKGIIAGLLTH